MKKIFALMLLVVINALTFVMASVSPELKEVPSLNTANIIFDNNCIDGIGKIMEYYGWIESDDGLTWMNRNGDEIRIVTDKDGRSLECVELLTVDSQKLGERLMTLRYSLASKEQREVPPGHKSIPRGMYVNGRKRVAVISSGRRMLIVFFRSSQQGQTRFGQ